MSQHHQIVQAALQWRTATQQHLAAARRKRDLERKYRGMPVVPREAHEVEVALQRTQQAERSAAEALSRLCDTHFADAAELEFA